MVSLPHGFTGSMRTVIAEDRDPRLRDTPLAIVDHEVIRAPQSQCTHREVQLPWNLGQG